MTTYSRYHKNFRQRRRECLEEFGNKCYRCGIYNRTIELNSEGEMYIVYLHMAHVFKDEEMNPDAYIIPLCPQCHWFFDHPRGDNPQGCADWYFIGRVARHFIEQESRAYHQTTGEQLDRH